MEHTKALRPRNLKGVAMATIVAEYPQHLICYRSSRVNIF